MLRTLSHWVLPAKTSLSLQIRRNCLILTVHRSFPGNTQHPQPSAQKLFGPTSAVRLASILTGALALGLLISLLISLWKGKSEQGSRGQGFTQSISNKLPLVLANLTSVLRKGQSFCSGSSMCCNPQRELSVGDLGFASLAWSYPSSSHCPQVVATGMRPLS